MANNQLSHGNVEFNDFAQFAANKAARILKGSVARTDTAAKTLGTIPANSTIIAVIVYYATASNAGTTATLSVGKAGGGEYLNALDLTAAAGSKYGGILIGVGSSDVTVTGIYAETGTAGTSGGPFSVYIVYSPAN